MLIDVLAEFVVARRHPARRTGAAKTSHDPARLRQGLARFDRFLQRRPTGESVLPRERRLSFVQSGELAGGKASFRLDFPVPEVRPAGKRTRLIGEGSPSSGARGCATSGWKDLPSHSPGCTGGLAALPADPAAAGNRRRGVRAGR